MNSSKALERLQLINILREFQKIRQFQGNASEFWQLFTNALIHLCNGRFGMICTRNVAGCRWEMLASGPSNNDSLKYSKTLFDALSIASEQCAQSGFAFLKSNNGSILATNLLFDTNPQNNIILLYLDPIDDITARFYIDSLLSFNDIPTQYRIQKSAYDSLIKQNQLTGILTLSLKVNEHNRFIAAAMTICNELASRFTCDLVSLGWYSKSYIRIKALSHTNHFEKKMEAIQQLELAMEESVDQDTEIVYPAPKDNSYVTRDHHVYTSNQGTLFMASLPLRKSNRIIGVCSLERCTTSFTDSEVKQIRIALDQITTRISELKHHDRWFGARLVDWLLSKAALLIGYEHIWAKLAAISGAIFFLFAAFVPINYRVSATMILKTDDIAYITAPFDGYIDSVYIRPGDLVSEIKTILTLDKNDLLLEEAGLLAEKNREQREIEKARAAVELADMGIAQARLNEVTAKLAITRYKLQQASIPAPFDGIIVEGDLREKIGSPVKQGDILFKIGRIANVYSEIKVPESEIQYILTNSSGQIALASRPHEKFDIKVTIIEPSAVSTQNDNVFLARSIITDTVPQWFRPGMTGIAKINAGQRTLLWIISHQTIDFLRLKLWW